MGAINGRYTSTVTQIEDLSRPYTLCKPLNYPTATLLHLNQAPAPIESVVRWGQVVARPRYTQINNAAGYTNAATTFVVDSNVGMFANGTYLYNTRTGEIMSVTAVNSNGVGITVDTRGSFLGGAAAAAILDNDVLEIRGPALAEKFTLSGVSTIGYDPTGYYNELERISYGVGISNTQLAIEERGGKPYGYGYADDWKQAMENVKRDINIAALRGIRYNNSGTTTSKVTKAGGLNYYAGWSDTSVGDLSDRTTFENLVLDLVQWAPGEFLCPASWTVMQAIQRLYQGEHIGAYNNQIIDKVGISVSSVVHPLGSTFKFYHEPCLSESCNSTTGTDVWTGSFFAFNPDYFKVTYNRPVGRYEVPPTTDGVTELCLAEFSFVANNSYAIGAYSGVTRVS